MCRSLGKIFILAAVLLATTAVADATENKGLGNFFANPMSAFFSPTRGRIGKATRNNTKPLRSPFLLTAYHTPTGIVWSSDVDTTSLEKTHGPGVAVTTMVHPAFAAAVKLSAIWSNATVRAAAALMTGQNPVYAAAQSLSRDWKSVNE